MPELGAQPSPSTWKLFESPTRGCLWRAHRVGVIDEIFCLRLAQSGPSTPPTFQSHRWLPRLSKSHLISANSVRLAGARYA